MFRRCSMIETSFVSTKMMGFRFIETSMRDAKIDNCDCTGALFVRCNLTNLSLKDTNVLGAIFEDCTDNGSPITIDWLRERGALNADTAIIYNSAAAHRLSF